MHAAQDADSVHTPAFNDEKLYLVARIADDIAPTLADRAEDRDMACRMAWRIVRSYAPTSEGEVLSAARIVSLSLTQLDLLRAAASSDLTATLKLKLLGTAVALNRSITQAERALSRSQRGEEVRRPKLPIPDEPDTPMSKNPAQAALADLGMRRARLRDEVARLEARAAKARQTLKPGAATTPAPLQAAPTAPPPLSRPIADPVEPAGPVKQSPAPNRAAPATPPDFNAVADFKRHVAAAQRAHRAVRLGCGNRAVPGREMPHPPPPA